MSISIEAPPQTVRGDDGVRLRLARGSIVLPASPPHHAQNAWRGPGSGGRDVLKAAPKNLSHAQRMSAFKPSSRKGVLFAAALVSLILSAPAALGQTPPRASTTAADLSSVARGHGAPRRPIGRRDLHDFVCTRRGARRRARADLVTTERASGSGVIVDPERLHRHQRARRPRRTATARGAVRCPPRGQSILATRSRTVSGQIVGIDLETDLAVIKVDERNLPPLAFGDSDELKAGQVVLAVRQSARPPQLGVARCGQRRRTAARARVADDLRADRRLDQSRQQRRPARRRARAARRHQHADRFAGRRQRGSRVCRTEQYRSNRVRADQKDRPGATRRHRCPRADGDAGARGRPESGARSRASSWPMSCRAARPRGRGCAPATSCSRSTASRWRTAGSSRSASIAARRRCRHARDPPRRPGRARCRWR